jgi:hypothetical protein
MAKEDKDIFYKYYLTVRWPAICRNRSLGILTERGDIVTKMNNFRTKLENVCRLILRKGYRIDSAYSMHGVKMWLESGQDVYDFIIRQPEFEWEIIPEIGTVNYLTGEFRKWSVIYTPTGITID